MNIIRADWIEETSATIPCTVFRFPSSLSKN